MAKIFEDVSRTFNEFLLIPNLTDERCIPSNPCYSVLSASARSWNTPFRLLHRFYMIGPHFASSLALFFPDLPPSAVFFTSAAPNCAEPFFLRGHHAPWAHAKGQKSAPRSPFPGARRAGPAIFFCACGSPQSAFSARYSLPPHPGQNMACGSTSAPHWGQ